jgi:hypothetical protein
VARQCVRVQVAIPIYKIQRHETDRAFISEIPTHTPSNKELFHSTEVKIEHNYTSSAKCYVTDFVGGSVARHIVLEQSSLCDG